MPSRFTVLIGSLVSMGFFAGSLYLGVVQERVSPGHATGGGADLIFLPKPDQARRMSLGFQNLVADYYWVKALQYYMDPTQSVNRYKNLGDYLDIVVGVDPDYEFAYKFAGLAIPYDVGRFHHVHTKRAKGFLERGVERFPKNWQLHFLLGYNYLNYDNSPVKAAEQFAAAAKLPGSPSYLNAFAARVYAVGGDLEQGLAFAEATLKETNDPEIAGMMRARILDLQVERELRRIEAGAKAFKEKEGRFPASIDELIAAGFGPRPPAGYLLGPDGVAVSTLSSERMILHLDPKQAGYRGE